jgi:hypothetical protein
MNSEKICLIGCGQAGARSSVTFAESFGISNTLLFNTTKDDSYKELNILKNENGDEFGSGRNPMYTLENVIPINEDFIKQKVVKSVAGCNSVILFTSLGGGSGSAISYHIIKNILIPMKETNENLKIYLVGILGFKHEGNPVCSNGIAMLNMFYSLTKDISIFPVQNDISYEEGTENTFDTTNKKIVDTIFNVLDYEYFLGKHKSDGIGTLDLREFQRVTGPSNGFLSYISSSLDEFNIKENPLNNFPIKTATSMIVMFRTKEGEAVNLNYLKKLEEMFPNALRIIAESKVENNEESTVDVIVNGLELPDDLMKQAEETIQKVTNLKEDKKEIKKKNKSNLKLGKKTLFKI